VAACSAVPNKKKEQEQDYHHSSSHNSFTLTHRRFCYYCSSVRNPINTLVSHTETINSIYQSMSNYSSVLLLVALFCIVTRHQANAFAVSRSRFLLGKRSLVSLLENLKREGGDIVSEQRRKHLAELKKEEWVSSSVEYYSKVMREERRKGLGQAPLSYDPSQQEEFLLMAKKHYFALRKIKDGKPFHAEQIYRKIIDELSQEEEGACDYAKLAVTTLLLALLLQRLGDFKATRSVFLNFFRNLMDKDDEECACSAKVLQAYALFEMKRGNPLKSLEIVNLAVRFDKSLAPVLQWKQFQDAKLRTTQTKRGTVQ
jgi:hypothetical protein